MTLVPRVREAVAALEFELSLEDAVRGHVREEGQRVLAKRRGGRGQVPTPPG